MDSESPKPRFSSIVPQLRKYPRLRLSTPFPCSFARVGLDKWPAKEQDGLGVVYDVSTRGARVMTEAVITPGDRIAMNLRLPDQGASMLATVRWGKEHTYGVEFESLSPGTDHHLQSFITRLSQSGLTLAV
jgi:PilZ domain